MTPVETEAVEIRDVPSRSGTEDRAPRAILWTVGASFVVWLLSSYAIRDFVSQFLQFFHKLLH